LAVKIKREIFVLEIVFVIKINSNLVWSRICSLLRGCLCLRRPSSISGWSNVV